MELNATKEAGTPLPLSAAKTSIHLQAALTFKSFLLNTGVSGFENPREPFYSEVWGDFHIFPNRSEKVFFNYWWLTLLVPSLILLLVSILVGQQLPIKGSDQIPGNGFYISLFASLAIFFSVVLWFKTIPPTFDFLLNLNVPNQEEADARKSAYCNYARKYRSHLNSNRRYLLIGGYLVVWVLFVMSTKCTVDTESMKYASLTIFHKSLVWIYYFVWLWGATFIGAYFAGATAWAMAISGYFLFNITASTGIKISPNHPDECGGLEPLAKFCLASAFPLMFSGIFFALFGANFFSLHLSSDFESKVHSFSKVCFIINLIVTILVFIIPLINIHKEMVRVKRLFQDRFSRKQELIIEGINLLLDKGKVTKAKEEKERLEILKTLAEGQYWPTWPVNRSITLSLVGRLMFSFIPWLGSIPKVKEFISDGVAMLIK